MRIRRVYEERFALIENAIARDDDADAERLCASAPRVVLTFGHQHAHAAAFRELAVVTFVELLDLAALYFDVMHTAFDAEEDEAEDGPALPAYARKLEAHYALGYILKTKTAAWMLWCKRRALPPLMMWSAMPGYPRLQRALKLTESAPGLPHGMAYTAEGMLLWLNRLASRRGEAEVTEMQCMTEREAETIEWLFQRQKRGHNGD